MRPTVFGKGVEQIDFLTQYFFAVAAGQVEVFLFDIQNYDRTFVTQQVRYHDTNTFTRAGRSRQQCKLLAAVMQQLAVVFADD